MSKRIGLVIGQLGWGGAERQLVRLAAGLDTGRELAGVFCLSQEEEPFGRELREMGVPLFALKRGGRREAGRVLRLASLLRRERIELAHSFLEVANIYTWLARPLAGGPLHLPSVRSLPLRESRLWHALAGRSLKSARFIIANSRAAAEACSERYRVPVERFRVVPNGLDLPSETSEAERSAARESLRLSPGNPVLGTVGRDEPDKNVAAFIRLAERVSTELGPVCALAAGRGLDESFAAHLSQHKRMHVCQALFLGPQNEMGQFYRALDLFVLTSLRESLPNALLEAMAHGLPCVAFAVGGVPEIVEHGVSGLLAAPGDEEGLLSAVLSLLRDPERARQMGLAARSRVRESFSIPDMLEGTRRVYAELEG